MFACCPGLVDFVGLANIVFWVSEKSGIHSWGANRLFWAKCNLPLPMRVEKPHQLGSEAAIQKIDTFLESLMQRPPTGGVVIKDPSKNWAGNVMDFSFKAKKGFLGATISGKVYVNDASVVMDADLPALIRTFVSEDKIRDAIGGQLDRMFLA